jgi:DNA polymerase-3 subunit gamma/tau
MELVGGAIVAMRDAPEPRITLEIALIRAARPEADVLPEAVLDRIERLERQLEAGVPSPGRPAASAPSGPAARGFPAARPEASLAPEPAPAPLPPVRAGDEPAGPRSGARPDAPSRDDLVTAWADDILPRLRPKVRAIYQAGRFVGTDGPDALLALPNEAHIAHAEPLRAEVVEALSRRFGQPVGVRLVAEAAATPRAPAGPAPRRGRRTPEVPAVPTEGEDLAEDLAEEMVDDAGLEPAPAPERSPSSADVIEGRLLEAFPGAEEV